MVIAGKRGDTSRKPPVYIFPDMDRQVKTRPQKEMAFFEDGRSSRLPVEGTVARGARFERTPVTTGMKDGTAAGETNYVDFVPVPVTAIPWATANCGSSSTVSATSVAPTAVHIEVRQR